MIRITTQVTGLEYTITRLNGLSRLKLDALADEIADASNEWLDDHFQNSYGPFGGWPGLSAATMSINPRRAGGSPLMDTGALRSGSRYDGQGNMVLGTSSVHYAKYHQNGPRRLNMFGRGIRATLPRRAFLGWTDGEIDEVRGICRDFIYKKIF